MQFDYLTRLSACESRAQQVYTDSRVTPNSHETSLMSLVSRHKDRHTPLVFVSRLLTCVEVDQERPTSRDRQRSVAAASISGRVRVTPLVSHHTHSMSLRRAATRQSITVPIHIRRDCTLSASQTCRTSRGIIKFRTHHVAEPPSNDITNRRGTPSSGPRLRQDDLLETERRWVGQGSASMMVILNVYLHQVNLRMHVNSCHSFTGCRTHVRQPVNESYHACTYNILSCNLRFCEDITQRSIYKARVAHEE